MDLTTFLHVVFESGFGLFCILAVIYLQLYGFVRVKTRRVITAALLSRAEDTDTEADASRTGALHADEHDRLDLILQADRVGLLNRKKLAEPKTEQ